MHSAVKHPAGSLGDREGSEMLYDVRGMKDNSTDQYSFSRHAFVSWNSSKTPLNGSSSIKISQVVNYVGCFAKVLIQLRGNF